MKRFSTLSFVASIVLVSTLIAGGLPAGATSKAQKAQQKAQKQLKLRALSLVDMPTGWVARPLTSIGDTPSCLKDLKTTAAHVTRVEVSYIDTPLPAFDQVLESGSGAAARFAKFNHSLATCKRISFNEAGVTLHGTVKPLTFPAFGDTSSSYALSFKYQKSTIGLDVVLVKVGNYVTGISFEEFGVPDIAQVESLVATATAALQFNPKSAAPAKTTTTTIVAST